MNTRHFLGFFAVLLLGLPSLAQSSLDITVRGPWIFYADTSKRIFDRPVLVLMAPAPHHPKNHSWPHMPPVISNGEGYVLDDGDSWPPKKSQIFCLLFDGKCAMQAGAFADGAHPLINPLSFSVSGWKWVSVSRDYFAPTLILPLPDSLSADNAWPMRFAKSFDVAGKQYRYDMLHSTGVVFHYTAGPTVLGLLGCPNIEPSSPGTYACNDSTIKIDHVTLYNKTGTLQIEMKAPDNNWSCDPHVRSIYPMMLDLVDPTAHQSDYSYIDPAYDFNQDGTGHYDEIPQGHAPPPANTGVRVSSLFCLEHDSQGGYVDTRWTGGGSYDKTVRPHPKVQTRQPLNLRRAEDDGKCQERDTWADCLRKVVDGIRAPELQATINQLCDQIIEMDKQDKSACEGQREVLQEMPLVYGSDSTLAFPRLSQLRRLDDDLAFVIGLKRLSESVGEKSKIHALTTVQVQILKKLQPVLDIAPEEKSVDPYGKTHGDCAAPVIHIAN